MIITDILISNPNNSIDLTKTIFKTWSSNMKKDT